MERPSEWWAILGPVTASVPAGIIPVPHNRAAVLDQEYELGPVRLRPGNKRLTGYLRTEPDQLAGVRVFESWPVLAGGRWPSQENDPDGRYAQAALLTDQDPKRRVVAQWLHRAACLLSLSFNEAWQVRSMAADSAAMPAVIPDDWPTPMLGRGLGGEIEASPRPLPEWSEAAWQRLDEDRRLATALTLWHQGLLLTPQFPSFAMVAFCGSIECLADTHLFKRQIAVEAEPCPECGNLPKAQARFWATVGLVRSTDEVSALRETGDPYATRSKTAHGTATHGVETMYGYTHLMIYTPPTPETPATVAIDIGDHTQQFMWNDLPAIRAVATDLLHLAVAAPR